jgi:hypothetical protein
MDRVSTDKIGIVRIIRRYSDMRCFSFAKLVFVLMPGTMVSSKYDFSPRRVKKGEIGRA